jgi:hypothetical protein
MYPFRTRDATREQATNSDAIPGQDLLHTALARSDHSLWLSTPGVERVRSGPLVPRLGRETVAGYVGVRENSIEESTRGYVDVLGAMLAKAVAAFGDVPVPELLPDEIGAWAKRLPGGTPP